MPLWGNTDAANSLPLFEQFREVLPVASYVTANNTTAGNTLVFTSNDGLSSITAGMYVYGADANTLATIATSRLAKDLSIVDQNDISFYRSNNVVTSVDAANSLVKVNNKVVGLPTGSRVWFGSAIVHDQYKYEDINDVILVTPTRLANTLNGSTGISGGANVSQTLLGNMNTGWNRITRKRNNDGTIRFLKETLVALANPVASNVSSGNTSTSGIFGGV
jgi:hypothetical protein